MVAGALDTILIPSLRLEEILSDGSTLSNPAADSRRLFLGEDGLLHLRDSAGTVTDIGGAGGSVATDAIWDAKGDLAGGTGSDTAARLAVGANDTILMADSAQTTGLKWVASQTPSTQAFSDSAAEGTADTYARGDHKHGMMASPGGGSGSILGTNSYAPGGTATMTQSSGTMGDADATNMLCTATTGASCLVMLSGTARAASGAIAGDRGLWGVRIGSTTPTGGGPAYVIYVENTLGGNLLERRTAIFLLTGLTPGSNIFKWGIAGGGTAQMGVYADANNPAVMVVVGL